MRRYEPQAFHAEQVQLLISIKNLKTSLLQRGFFMNLIGVILIFSSQTRFLSF